MNFDSGFSRLKRLSRYLGFSGDFADRAAVASRGIPGLAGEIIRAAIYAIFRPYFAALVRAVFSVALYGTHWDRFAETRRLTRGQLPIAELPKGISGARIALCFVRRSNRDGHCNADLRSSRCGRVHADGGHGRASRDPRAGRGLCPLFRTMDEMIAKAKWLLQNNTERARLAFALRAHIRTSSNTYANRMTQILEAVAKVDRSNGKPRPIDVPEL